MIFNILPFQFRHMTVLSTVCTYCGTHNTTQRHKQQLVNSSIMLFENSKWVCILFMELFLLFLPGSLNVPAVALGVICGGFVMKRFQLSVVGATKMFISTYFLAFLFMLSQYFLHCGNAQVAGLTVSYQG